MKYLVDADVLSESTKREPNERVLRWLDEHDLDIVVNPIVLGELRFGILLMPAGRKRAHLLEWLGGAIDALQVVGIDQTTAEVWATLIVNLRRKGLPMPVRDSLIAASALQYELAVATRNVRDFEHAGVKILNPFASGHQG